MDVQFLLVVAVFAACAVYAAWSMMPAALRSSLASLLLRLPVGGGLAAWLRRVERGAMAGGCGGCDRNPGVGGAQLGAGVHVVRIHRRGRR